MNKWWYLVGVVTLTACSSAPLEQPVEQSFYRLVAQATQAYNEARLNTAETLYLQVLQRNPDYSEANFKLGNIYSRQGRLDAAVIKYEQALAADRSDGRAWHNLALVRVKQAVATLDIAEQEIAPDSPYYQYLLQLQLQLNKVSGNRHDDTER
ncbi:Tetratricopeptide repeat-containing protein [Rheinheimera pacifica]|uniref:Tetratricopeptide repeat-containing protein n=1 Tax=Rheinheimera pacifica TaxID=173990 RepID=A0A1H6LA51_9GAMM|nr:tetratricopeptide repeat protein [Rheinheimera pacifica]SEH81159.1 Tetratricopeptide repeat-containing protein [Rheinheimera pacifica]